MRGRTTDEPPTNHERLTVAQASEALEITEGAVRSRIKRGTLPTAREGGTVYVLLGAGTSEANQPAQGGEPGDRPGESDALTSEMRGRIDDLREQLEAERQAHAEARRIIAGLVERLPSQLEAPQEPSEDAETVEKEPEGAEPRPDAPGSQGDVHRPWWRRMFGS